MQFLPNNANSGQSQGSPLNVIEKERDCLCGVIGRRHKDIKGDGYTALSLGLALRFRHISIH